MKSIEVVAAIIHKDDRILATQRGYGEFIGGWEFPGGKVEPGEDGPSALRREILEELNACVIVENKLITVTHQYESFHLTMHCYWCELTSDFELLEHEAARWLAVDELDSVDWLPADIDVVMAIKQHLGECHEQQR